MRKISTLIVTTVLFAITACSTGNLNHLFILSGQSNMARLDPSISFIPAIEKEFGKENVTVIHNAQRGAAIENWYDNDSTNHLYKRLMDEVKAETQSKKFGSVTFIWMQGEANSKKGKFKGYKEKLEALIYCIKKDLNIENMNVVIGRISDYGMRNQGKYIHWPMMRKLQVKFAKDAKNRDWVNCDDLNDNCTNKKGHKVKNDLHYSAEGYKILGERFAEKAIKLIKK